MIETSKSAIMAMEYIIFLLGIDYRLTYTIENIKVFYKIIPKLLGNYKCVTLS